MANTTTRKRLSEIREGLVTIERFVSEMEHYAHEKHFDKMYGIPIYLIHDYMKRLFKAIDDSVWRG